MAKYYVVNKSTFAIQITIPGLKGRNSTQLTLNPSGSLNIMPWAGSRENCKRIAHIHDLQSRGLVDVVEEE